MQRGKKNFNIFCKLWAENCTKIVWRLRSARTRWGYSVPQTSIRYKGEGREGEGKGIGNITEGEDGEEREAGKGRPYKREMGNFCSFLQMR